MSKHGDYVNSLLKKIKKGDTAAFMKLYDCTYNHLRFIVLRYLKNASLLEDVMQESFMRVFKYVKNADLEQDGYNWMCKIAENCAYEFNRRFDNYTDLEAVEECKDPREVFAVLDDRVDLYNALHTLNDEELTLIFKRFWEDFTYESMADEFSSKKSTIHKKLKQIFAKLKSYL